MTTVNFTFGLRQRVEIVDAKIQGTIDSMNHGSEADEYRIVYWHNGERKSVWMYEWEIAATKEAK